MPDACNQIAHRTKRRSRRPPLGYFETHYLRNEAMVRAYLTGQYSMAGIARHFGVHYSTVSRAVKGYEDGE